MRAAICIVTILAFAPCASASPPLLPVDWTEPAPLDDKPKKPEEKPAPAPAPKKPPPPQDNDQFKCEGHTCPQPVDPSPHSVAESKCAAESRACLDCALACAARKGCSPQECVAVCAKVDECMARPRR